jgi:hypothetical protein
MRTAAAIMSKKLLPHAAEQTVCLSSGSICFKKFLRSTPELADHTAIESFRDLTYGHEPARLQGADEASHQLAIAHLEYRTTPLPA